jgi:hypothetical protein
VLITSTTRIRASISAKSKATLANLCTVLRCPDSYRAGRAFLGLPSGGNSLNKIVLGNANSKKRQTTTTIITVRSLPMCEPEGSAVRRERGETMRQRHGPRPSRYYYRMTSYTRPQTQRISMRGYCIGSRSAPWSPSEVEPHPRDP